jgi:hypothetical protein
MFHIMGRGNLIQQHKFTNLQIKHKEIFYKDVLRE